MSDKTESIIECLNCKNFFGCKVKSIKNTSKCVNFEERAKVSPDGRRKVDKDSN